MHLEDGEEQIGLKDRFSTAGSCRSFQRLILNLLKDVVVYGEEK